VIIHGKEYLYIDGYNIINAWDELKNISRVNLDLARDRLLEICSEYQAYSGVYIIVVFDAHLQKGRKEVIKEQLGVQIVFTKERQTADHYIEQQVDKWGYKRKITVATSDYLEQQVVMGRGARRISARELLMKINMVKKKYIANNSKESSKVKIESGFDNSLNDDELEKLEQFKMLLDIDSKN
jgi:predicted RNA-binding protein with PIN domain